MPIRSFASLALTAVLFVGLGCNTVPHSTYRQAHFRAHHMYRANQQTQQHLALERSQVQQMQQQLAANQAEQQRLRKQLAEATGDLDVTRNRLVNLQDERGELQKRYVDLLKSSSGMPDAPLSPAQNKRFEALAAKYPNFDFDPTTGVGKFHSDILFPIGSDEIRPDAHPVLKEFVEILNESDSGNLNILVVGHTDDRAIAKLETAEKHPTNWHLSTDRANAVVNLLAGFGLAEQRMGAAGYSKFQPVAANTDEQARTRNRRVEIYILAPEAAVAGWNSGTVTE